MRFLMPAAGWCKTVDHVRKLARVPTITHIVMGSFTVEPRAGNNGGTNFDVLPDGTAVNSLGLPNGGLRYLKEHGDEMVKIARDAGKRPVISIAGFSPHEYWTLAKAVNELKVLAELNIGCPNVHDGGHQKEIVSYDSPLLRKTLDAVFQAMPSNMVWVKPSPYANPTDRERFVEAVQRYEIDAIVGCNTFPNVSLYHDDGRPLLNVADNYAGMSGTALKPINLSQCRYYAQRLPGVQVIGAGGIASAKDLADYGRVGCVGGQIGAAFFHGENYRVFEEVAPALAEAA
jgi:dihydroorotate dehydrogenase